MTTKRGTARAVHLDGQRAVVVGGGPLDEVDADVLRDAAAAVVNELRASTGGAIAWPLDEAMPLSLAEQAGAVVEGGDPAPTTPGRGRPTPEREWKVTHLALVNGQRRQSECNASGEGRALGESRAWDLVNRPANDLSPASFAEYAAGLAEVTPGLSAEALEPDEDAQARDGRPPRRRSGQLQRAPPHRHALGAAGRRRAPTSCSASSARALPSTPAASASSPPPAWRR